MAILAVAFLKNILGKVRTPTVVESLEVTAGAAIGFV